MPEVPNEQKSRRAAVLRLCRPTFSYWMETEVHVYGFSIAANVLLSFFPFLIVMLSLCRNLLGWNAGVAAIGFVLDGFFPGEFGNRNTMLGFIGQNLLARTPRELPIFSLFLLMFTANGVFEPMEVALNRAWGVTKNRSFLRNQLISFGLIFACGTLGLVSTVLTGVNLKFMGMGSAVPGGNLFPLALLKTLALSATILGLFLIYWLLPNVRLSWRAVAPQAILTGIAIEVLKYINLASWPLISGKFSREYGPFYFSVTIILWSFLGAMVILAGAEWAARRARARAASGADV
jgi:membrane protein